MGWPPSGVRSGTIRPVPGDFRDVGEGDYNHGGVRMYELALEKGHVPTQVPARFGGLCQCTPESKFGRWPQCALRVV